MCVMIGVQHGGNFLFGSLSSNDNKPELQKYVTQLSAIVEKCANNHMCQTPHSCSPNCEITAIIMHKDPLHRTNMEMIE